MKPRCVVRCAEAEMWGVMRCAGVKPRIVMWCAEAEKCAVLV